MKYEELLERAYELLPEKAKTKERFEIPTAEVEIVGKSTVIKNFTQICSILNRDPKHVAKFLTRELATSGNIEGSRLRLKGRFPTPIINKRIKEYAEEYVLCHECGKPDTRIIEMMGVKMLKCDACGAIRPIKEL